MKDDALQKLKSDLESSQKSLTAKMSDLKNKISTMKQFKDHTILCDVSGSMASYVGYSREAKSAKDIVQDTIDNFKGAKIYEFSSRLYFKKNGKLSEPKGGTNLGGAFRDIKTNGIKQLTLLTDGQPDNEQHALNEAIGLKVDIIYIGPQPTPAFLIKLAQVTGGNFADVELIKLGNQASEVLENKIRLLIGDGK